MKLILWGKPRAALSLKILAATIGQPNNQGKQITKEYLFKICYKIN